jgi:hypothetical protein
MDNQGNVQFLVGFLADHLANLNTSTPQNASLGTREGTQAYFAWLPTYTWAAPTTGGGTGGTFSGTYSFVVRHSGKAIDVAGGGTGNGTNIQQWAYYTSNNNERFQVTHLGSGWHRISPVISPGQAIDVSGVSTANGANVHTWAWGNGTNQQWRFEDVGGGYWRIIARHSNKCLDVLNNSLADGGNIAQWDCIAGAQNQSFQVISRAAGRIAVGDPEEPGETSGSSLFTVFPNPSSSGDFSINIPSDEKTSYRLNILGADGRNAYETDDLVPGINNISTDLNKGMYFIRIEGYNHTVKKFIIR